MQEGSSRINQHNCNVSMIDNLGGGVKVAIIGPGKYVPCCFNVQVSNTVIDGTHVYHYNSDVRTSIALFIKEEWAAANLTLNVSLSNVQISNSYIVDSRSKPTDFQKITTILFSDVLSVYIENSTIANNNATGIQTVSSVFHLTGQNTLENNSGALGGALSLDGDTKMYLHPDSVLIIVGNRASSYGGGIAIDSGRLKGYPTPCFYQLIPKDSDHILSSGAQIFMEENNASIAGHSIYGNFMNCTQLYQNLIHQSLQVPAPEIFSATFFVKNTKRDSEFSSVAVGLCYCDENNTYINTTTKSLYVYPGEQFTVGAIGIGINGTTFPAFISGSIMEPIIPGVKLVNNGAQSLERNCTNLLFHLEAPENVANIGIRLVAEGSAYPISYSRSLNITTGACPVGFQLMQNSCVCSPALHSHSVDCFINNQSFSHSGSVWIYFTNQSTTNKQEVLYHKHCLPEYCKTGPVNFNAASLDAQCENGHSGILCGGCMESEGFSVALGSSKCVKCTNTYLALIPAFALAGILLVAVLIVLNLTVATGTINGLVFYANIVQAPQANFGISVYGHRFFSVFIAWLNLDFGFETCFFSGLDVYTKTFLQFLFPVYIWILVAVIIVSSHYSTRMARLSGNNAVPVLATLFLLSYAKIQRAIIVTFSFTFIHREHGTSYAVWLYDGNVDFLRGKHVFLFIASLLFAVLYIIPLTLLVLFAPCLQRIRYYRIARIMSRIKPLIDAYQGPYKDSFRFWTGLILVVRTLLLIGFVTNVSSDPDITLFVIILVSSLVALVSLLRSGGVYRNILFTILECFYLYNLIVFASWSLFNRYNLSGTSFIKRQQVAIHVMVGLSVAVFTITVLCHIYKERKHQIPREYLNQLLQPDDYTAIQEDGSRGRYGST